MESSYDNVNCDDYTPIGMGNYSIETDDDAIKQTDYYSNGKY